MVLELNILYFIFLDWFPLFDVENNWLIRIAIFLSVSNDRVRFTCALSLFQETYLNDLLNVLSGVKKKNLFSVADYILKSIKIKICFKRPRIFRPRIFFTRVGLAPFLSFLLVVILLLRIVIKWAYDLRGSVSTLDFPGGAVVKNSPANAGNARDLAYPWRRKWQPTPVVLRGESHGQRSLTSYIPWGPKSPKWLSICVHGIRTCSLDAP